MTTTHRTITLTDRPPVRISEDHWPVIASSTFRHHDNEYESQANRRWKGDVRVRQHADGRTLVYAVYLFETAWRGERGETAKTGELLPSADVTAIVAAIHRVTAHQPAWCTDDLAAGCIADLPADVI